MPYRQRLNVTSAWAAALFVGAGVGAAQAADIHLQLTNANGSPQGRVHAALLPLTEQQWQATPVQTLHGTPELRFIDVAPGEYAVQLFVDLNDNGKLDYSPRGIPSEPVGFSGNPSLLRGMPGIRAAAFRLGDTDLKLTIRLREPRRAAPAPGTATR